MKLGRRVYVIGNGGSLANAAHMVNDLLASGIKAYTIDLATMTAFANDLGYENAFAKWIEIVGEPEDTLIALSGSGKSPNILNAVEQAERIGMTVHKVFGADMGMDMQKAEEYQIVLAHSMRKLACA